MIDGVIISPLKIIRVDEGDIYHGMKRVDKGYCGFGEAYFSSINYGETKGWKRHHEMTLNIIVPNGKIQFALFDDRNKVNFKRLGSQGYVAGGPSKWIDGANKILRKNK